MEIKPGDRLARDEYEIVVFETEHRADTVGYALVEHIRLGRFNPDRARALGIPEGPLLGPAAQGKDGDAGGWADGWPRRSGRRRRGPAAPWCTPAILVPTCRSSRRPGAPTSWCTRPLSAATRSERASETGHSTAAEAARVALEAGRPAAGADPISSRYNRDAAELLAEARAVFPETMIARDGMTVDVPYVDGE